MGSVPTEGWKRGRGEEETDRRRDRKGRKRREVKWREEQTYSLRSPT